MTCEKCGVEYGVGDYPFCKGGHGRPSLNVQDDSWANGKTFENLAHEPVTFYSKTEYKAFLKQTGQMEFVRHVGLPGSDRNPHTTRWI